MLLRFTIIFLMLYSPHCHLGNSFFQLNFSQVNVWMLLFSNFLIFISSVFFFIFNVKFIFFFFLIYMYFFLWNYSFLSLSCDFTDHDFPDPYLIILLICSLIFWSISPLLSHKLSYFLPRSIVFKQICRGNGRIMTGMLSELKYSYNGYKYLGLI